MGRGRFWQRKNAAGALWMAIPTSVIYTRKDCHLCEQAKATLRANGLEPQEIDIDQHENLRSKYDLCVPVVEIDGRERFRGRVDEILLRRLLRTRD